MIKWKRDYTYFRELCDRTRPAMCDVLKWDMKMVHDFAKKYNCLIHDYRYFEVFECSEEDFLLVTLTCPEAIDEVVHD